MEGNGGGGRPSLPEAAPASPLAPRPLRSLSPASQAPSVGAPMDPPLLCQPSCLLLRAADFSLFLYNGFSTHAASISSPALPFLPSKQPCALEASH